MPLGVDVGLGPGDIMLDADPAPPRDSGTAALTFRAMCIVAKRSSISAAAELLLGTDTNSSLQQPRHLHLPEYLRTMA